MGTPINERGEPQYHQNLARQRSSDDDGTVVGTEESARLVPEAAHTGNAGRARSGSHLTIQTEHDYEGDFRSMASPSQNREQEKRLGDDLAMLEIERQISKADNELDREHSKSMRRTRSRREDPIDEFDAATNPLHERTAIYKPPENPSTNLSKLFKRIHSSVFIVRYFFYILPLFAILLIPVLLGFFRFPDATVGCVELKWFGIWLEIVWLTLWAGRIVAKCLPWPIGLISSLFTNNGKKWRDMGKQLELPATLFFWWLAIEVSFLPTMNSHLRCEPSSNWRSTMNKVLVSIFVGVILNFVEKIIIQLIAISFHLRTYADRIEINKFQIGSLAKLYKFSKEKIAMEDSEFEDNNAPSGARTPGRLVDDAKKTTKQAMGRFGDVAGKIAGDFTGKQVVKSTHPNQVVLALLSTTGGSQVLARRLYRTFARPETETVYSDDLKGAFENDDEADAAFSMFDKDMNGDISMEELEAVCVEIGRERKSITASLKDLDSVVSKLDDVFMFLVTVITILVFISLISTSAAGVLTSAGSAVLALSWLFSATAQEFLQSIIFVFVKHPFDVGDRVSIYGNTGAAGLGDDYFVKEIALLYTEFKKMEGHVVQAPNSYLNTLFILNQRRSGGLAEALPVVIKFGTTLEQIETLRNRLLEFVRNEKREYQSNILTELREVKEAHSLTLNIVFFYKSNWQNELLRLQRRNKFICAMMVTMQECGIEGPRMRFPGQKESFPVYLQNVPHIGTPDMGHGGHPDMPQGHSHPNANEDQNQNPPFVAPQPDNHGQTGLSHHPSILRQAGRPRGESLAAMGRRVDFSLGMKDVSSGDMYGDVYEDRSRSRLPPSLSPSRESQERGSRDIGRSSSVSHGIGPGNLARVSTDNDSRMSHRNRFFGRNKSARDEESGMANIPEGGAAPPQDPLDPRSGTVDPAAVHNVDGSGARVASGALPRTSVEQSPHTGSFKRTATEDFEMRRL